MLDIFVFIFKKSEVLDSVRFCVALVAAFILGLGSESC